MATCPDQERQRSGAPSCSSRGGQCLGPAPTAGQAPPLPAMWVGAPLAGQSPADAWHGQVAGTCFSRASLRRRDWRWADLRQGPGRLGSPQCWEAPVGLLGLLCGRGGPCPGLEWHLHLPGLWGWGSWPGESQVGRGDGAGASLGDAPWKRPPSLIRATTREGRGLGGRGTSPRRGAWLLSRGGLRGLRRGQTLPRGAPGWGRRQRSGEERGNRG